MRLRGAGATGRGACACEPGVPVPPYRLIPSPITKKGSRMRLLATWLAVIGASALSVVAAAAPASAAGDWCDTGNFFYKPNAYVSYEDAEGLDVAAAYSGTEYEGPGGYCIPLSYGYASGGGSGAATSLGTFVRTGSLTSAAGASAKVSQFSDGLNTLLQAGRTILGALSGIGNLSMLFDPEAEIFAGTGDDLSGWVNGDNTANQGGGSRPVYEFAVTVLEAPSYGGSGDVRIAISSATPSATSCSLANGPNAYAKYTTGTNIGAITYSSGGTLSGWSQVCEGQAGYIVMALTGVSNFGGLTLNGLTWYAEGAPGRYEHTPAGVPTGSVRVDQECIQANGVISVLTESAAIAVDGSVMTPEIACPVGSVAGDTTITHVGGSGTETVIGGAAADAFTRSIPDEFPNCTDGGCTFELWQLPGDGPALFCGSTALGCPDWMTQVQTNPDSYQCRFGGYSVDLGYCAVYRDPGTVMPLVGYELDPTTGTITQTTTVPTVSTDPTAYTALDVLLRQFLEDLAAYEVDPSDPTPSAPVAGEVTIGGASDTSGECFPSGWGIFNPIEWVYQPVKCALEWAFVPGQAATEALLYQGTQVFSSHGILGVVPAAAAIPSQVQAGWVAGCGDGLVTFSAPTAYGDLEASLPCSPGDYDSSWGTAYGVLYTLMTALVVLGGAWAAYLIIRAQLGTKDVDE